MRTVKTQMHRFPFIIITTIVPNDTRIHVILKVPCTISFNCSTGMYISTVLYKNEQK